MTIDQQAVIAAYNDASRPTVPQVATQFQLKPADVAAILRLNAVPIRKGNVRGANNLTAEARAKGHEVRANKAMLRILAELVERHGLGAVEDALAQVSMLDDQS